jgi:hypothetical protein
MGQSVIGMQDLLVLFEKVAINPATQSMPLRPVVALAKGTTIIREPRPKEVLLGCALLKGMLEALNTTYWVTGSIS